jgi:hypothetical protein
VESWRLIWRDGFAPGFSDNALQALADGLRRDDPRLTQGSTVTPPPLMRVQDWPVEAACCLAYAGWQGEGLRTVGECQEYFARACFDADERLREPAACRWFLNWFDDTPRTEMRRELLAECELAMRGRLSLAQVAEGVGLIPETPWSVVADFLDDAAQGAEASRIRRLHDQGVSP